MACNLCKKDELKSCLFYIHSHEDTEYIVCIAWDCCVSFCAWTMCLDVVFGVYHSFSKMNEENKRDCENKASTVIVNRIRCTHTHSKRENGCYVIDRSLGCFTWLNFDFSSLLSSSPLLFSSLAGTIDIIHKFI